MNEDTISLIIPTRKRVPALKELLDTVKKIQNILQD